MNLNAEPSLSIAGAAGLARRWHLVLWARPDALASDTTLCAGCRGCEAACSEANGLAGPEKPGDPEVFAAHRTTTPVAFTVVNAGSHKSPSGEDRFAKAQCMHCVDPACASGCVVRALEKTAAGP
jgi:Fe-S-cluster-containing dehydrogenase component